MKNEVEIYKMVSIICFIAMIGMGWMTLNAKQNWKKENLEKIEYCKKYYKLKCQ